MLDRIIGLSCELPILFSNNFLRRRQYGRALLALEVSGLLGVPASGVLRVFGKGA